MLKMTLQVVQSQQTHQMAGRGGCSPQDPDGTQDNHGDDMQVWHRLK